MADMIRVETILKLIEIFDSLDDMDKLSKALPPESYEEALIVFRMKKRADEYGLWDEVKEAYDRYRANGDTPSEASACAMYDWDL